jgi:hypothetical protein
MLQENKADPFPGLPVDYPAAPQGNSMEPPRSLEIPKDVESHGIPVVTTTPSRKWIYSGAIIAVIAIIIFAFVVLNSTSSVSPLADSHINANPYPAIQSPAPAPSQQERWISALIKKSVLNPGDTARIEGTVTGSNDPVSFSVITVEDFNAENFNRPYLTDSVTPSSDGTFTAGFPVDSRSIPPGYYIIFLKLPTGEWTKLPLLVEAKGISYVQNSSNVLIAGVHEGYFKYDDSDHQREYPFSITVNQTDSIITGTIWESEEWAFGPSTFKGSVTGTTIKFIKTYNRGNYQVTCKGMYYPDTGQISGTWINDDLETGTFTINLTE